MALVVLAGAALAGTIGFAGGPAYGQAAGVGNSGQASAGTGGNSSVGNASGNAALDNQSATTPSGGLLGGLLGAVLDVAGGETANDSGGTSTVTGGPATASGNNSDTGVSQSGGGGAVAPVHGPFKPVQAAEVTNAGAAEANTGGNRSVGNDSANLASSDQTVTGGLLAVGIDLLGGGASNNSTGTSTINTGPATASGNEAVTTVEQAGLGAGRGVVCDGHFRFGGQRVEVENVGAARANTGGNASVGNQSTNVATNNQTVSGGLIGLGLNLLSGPTTNVSDGSSAITSGAATASGNRSTTEVTQDCLRPVSAVSPRVISTPHGPGVAPLKVSGAVAGTQQLAKTGVDPFVSGLIAFSLLFGGLLFLVWERMEALPAGAGRAPAA